VKEIFCSTRVAVTLACGIELPLGSATKPLIVPVTCANTAAGKIEIRRATITLTNIHVQ